MALHDANSANVEFDSPYAYGAAVTPHDTNDLATATRGLYIGSAGNLKVDLVGGDTVTLNAVPVGFHPLRVTRVYATVAATAASDIVALW